MALDIEWHIPDAVLLQTYRGRLDLDAIINGFTQTVQMMEESHAPEIHILADQTRLTHVSAPFARLQTLIVRLFDHPKQGSFVVYGADSPLLPFLTHCQIRMGGINLQLVNTQDAALRYLHAFSGLELRAQQRQ